MLQKQRIKPLLLIEADRSLNGVPRLGRKALSVRPARRGLPGRR